MINSRYIFKPVIYSFILAIATILLFFSAADTCISKSSLPDSINLSAGYIVKFTNPDGKFDYEVDPENNSVNQNKYNILRHSGAIYSLGQYYRLNNDKKVLDTMVKASEYLKSCCILSVNGNEDLLAVWSLPELNSSLKSKKAKLGGTGLGLVALVSLEKIKPGSTDIDYLRRLGNFILYMQKEDGSFYSRFTPSKGGRDDSWTSLYYPGEAALGLAMLFELDPQPKWFNASVKALTYLADNRRGDKEVPADHWALISTNKLIKTADENSLSIPRQKLIDHGIRVTDTILKGIPVLPKTSPVYGSLQPGGRTTPTSSRLEGLIAFYSVLHDSKLKKEIRTVSKDGIMFLEQMQIKKGRYKGGIPEGFKGINIDTGLIRIDYVQHALSAMIEYQNLIGT
ncbi:MAG: hypothetical protein ACR2NC_02070 [Thermodesulfobacteriota bacterium]